MINVRSGLDSLVSTLRTWNGLKSNCLTQGCEDECGNGATLILEIKFRQTITKSGGYGIGFGGIQSTWSKKTVYSDVIHGRRISPKIMHKVYAG